MSFKRRRSFLRASGVAVVAGLSGCVFGSSGSQTTTFQGRSYDVRFTNDIKKEDLRGGHDEETKATLSLEVDRVQEGENEVLFERSAEVDLGSSKTVEDAFSTEPEQRYGVNATLTQPYISLSGRGDDLRTGYVFDAGSDNTPSNGRVEVTAVNARPDGPFVFPEVRLGDVDPRR
jgi:hypothetical protein